VDVNMILQLTWPARPGQTLLESATRDTRKPLEAFIKRWEKSKFIPYDQVLEFAKDPRFASVMLTPLAQRGIFELFAANSGDDTRLALAKRADQSLSLAGAYTYSWTEQIHFLEDGSARLYAWKGLSHATSLRRIRKEYLK
jgi:hypothetical protein